MVGSLSLLIAPTGGVAPKIIGAFCLIGAPLLFVRQLRAGVEITQQSVRVHSVYLTRAIPRPLIVGITTKPVFTSKMVYLVLRGGGTAWTGLAQGVTVAWEGGRTVDIVGVLESELGVSASRSRT
ncbi:MAG TPA: hypothetical protein VHT27_05770 [Solirubrobacteraceae bacterium]|nr:hypothetical protein [Solirubrobacteraceae bacterium]